MATNSSSTKSGTTAMNSSTPILNANHQKSQKGLTGIVDSAAATNIQSSETKSYREMLQIMKKFNQTLEKLQEEAAELQTLWSDSLLQAAIVFDPEVAQILNDDREQ